MSKRFGRNQKRKMRAEVDQWKAAHKRESNLAKHLRIQGQRDRETVKRVADILGEHFAALDPKTVLVDRMIGYLRLPSARLPSFSFGLSRGFNEPVEIAISELEANWMELKADKLTNQQFVLLQSPGGDIGYAISGIQMKHLDADRLAREVADAMAAGLAKSFRSIRNT